MSKYIIRNCPAFVLMRTATSGTYFNICGTAKGHAECKDCTDCLLKKIIELCKEDWEDMTVSKFQSELLNKLDIQECEND